MNIITGNRFLDISDQFFNGTDFINNEKVNNNTQIVFCETHNLNAFFTVCEKKINGDFILISHNSDGCIMTFKYRSCDYQFKESNLPGNLVAWYAQNLDVISPKIRPLPIGLENFKWHKGKKWQDLAQISVLKIPRNKMVYMNFEVGTNPAERNACFNALCRQPFVTRAMTKVSYIEYITAMKRHYFVVCPEGNGYDTHRLWECLYMGCIPIVRRRVFTETMSKLFPMILIDDWESINLNRLKSFIGDAKNYCRMMEFYKQKNALSFSFWHKVVEII